MVTSLLLGERVLLLLLLLGELVLLLLVVIEAVSSFILSSKIATSSVILFNITFLLLFNVVCRAELVTVFSLRL